MSAHSKLGASSAKRWLSCPGSVRLISKCPPSPDSKYAAEGTTAHSVAEMLFKGEEVKPGQWIKTTSGEHKADSKMIAYAQAYVSEVLETQKELKGELLVEKRFSLPTIHPAMFGTNDACIVSHEKKTLHVFDLKYGAGIAVEAFENPQLVFYALGAAFNEDFLTFDRFDTIKMSIFQPRAPHPDGILRTWAINFDELMEWKALFKIGAKLTEIDDAPLIPSPESCRFCAASAMCPALKNQANQRAVKAFSEGRPNALPELLAIEEVAEIYSKKKLIETFLDACEERIKFEVLSGKSIPGVKVVRGNSKRKWYDDQKAEAFFKRSLGDKIYDFKSVPEMEKLVGKKEFAKIASSLFVEIAGDLTIAPESDKRKAVDLPKDIFN
jgi:hypothetical protein